MTHRVTDAANHPKSRGLFNQLRRAAGSVEANIVEGYALGTSRQFARHLRIAMGSAAEAESHLRLAVELGYLSASTTRELESLLGGAMKAIHGLLRGVPYTKGR